MTLNTPPEQSDEFEERFARAMRSLQRTFGKAGDKFLVVAVANDTHVVVGSNACVHTALDMASMAGGELARRVAENDCGTAHLN